MRGGYERSFSERFPIREITPLDPEFPERLRQIPDCPSCLYLRGELPSDHSPSVSIIGARDGSPYGREIAEAFAGALAGRGVSIVSGMARGIDTAGHWGALKGGGRTYAVLGCGADICYPRSNYELYEKIAEQGGILSEFPAGTAPLPANFVRRNRLISGLSDAVLVIEAKERSGTSITVGHALEQGKQVFALPGRITDHLSFGCNQLIRQGAELLSCVEDVLSFLHLEREGELLLLPPKEEELSELQRKVFSALDTKSIHIEELSRLLGLPTEKLSGILLELELLGFSESPKCAYYRRRCFQKTAEKGEMEKRDGAEGPCNISKDLLGF